MSDEARIVIAENGPYLVYGGVPVSVESIEQGAAGGSWAWRRGPAFEQREVAALCRCGHSESKPYCDGTHKARRFDGTETASRASYEEQAETIDGPALELQDADRLCAFARFCDSPGRIWDLVPAAAGEDAQAIVEHQGTHCPSGRLVVRDKRSGEAAEPALAREITLIEDPEKACSGPLWVKGGIAIVSQDGRAYETRNRVTLCRCGASANKPFCDGSHVDVAFQDGLTSR